MNVTNIRHEIISHCPVCDSDDLEDTGVAETYYLRAFNARTQIRFSACRSCGFFFQSNPLALELANEYYNANNQLRFTELLEVEEQVHGKQAQFIAGPISFDALKVLEIGANTGKLLDYLKKKHGCDTWFDELNNEACRILIGNHHNKYEDNSGSFDLVIMRHVLEHIVRPHSFLQNHEGALGENGLLFIEVPDWSELDDVTDPVNFEHVNHFSQATLTRLLDRAGFNVVRQEMDRTEGYPTTSNRVLRILARQKRTPLSEGAAAFHHHYEQGVCRHHVAIDRFISAQKNGIRIAMYGASWWTERAFCNTTMDKNVVCAIFDRDPRKQAEPFYGVPVLSPDTIEEVAPDVIFVLNAFEAQIKKELLERGFEGLVIGWTDLPNLNPL